MLGYALRALALKPVQRWSPERIAALQHRRLQALVRYAIAHSPHYRDRFHAVNPDRFRLTDLPPISKTELMADFDRTVTDRSIRRADLERFVDNPANEGRWFLGRYAVSHTSGSQGQPLLMVSDRRHLELLFALQQTRGYTGKVTPLTALQKLIDPARLAVVTLKKGFYPSASAFEYMPPGPRRFMKVLRLSQTDPDVVEQLNRFRPTALTAYASVLDMLALEVEAGRLQLAPELQQVVNNSECLSDAARQRISRAFGLHVLNNYATGECPFLTNGCPTDEGAHVNADWAILEVVDDQNNPVPPGQPGRKVLITNLANRVQPIIRYEVGDIVTMATEPCRCGSRLPRVLKIEGRAADTFYIKDGDSYRQLINSVFKNAFDYTREVREWQAIQVERNKVVIKLELLPGHTLNHDHAWWSLERQLRMYDFYGKLDLSLEVVPRLTSDQPSGKFRRMVSLVGPPGSPDSHRASAKLRHDPPHSTPHPILSPHLAGKQIPES
ncbi:MAG: adenylyltransferase [Isosphaeraceae bacterium]|nr:MAG: adenylyltransferase [Isosphaeraceae bacterium]